MNPEEKLQRQSAIARSRSQTQKAKHYKQPNDTNATIIGYDAATGQTRIRLPDGSITYAQSDTNGAIALRETVPLHGGTGNIDGLPNYKKQLIPIKKAPIKKVGDMKILFSTETILDGSYRIDYFIGGDRASPVKIGEVTLAYPPDLSSSTLPYLHNTGVKKNDWLVYADFHNMLYDSTNTNPRSEGFYSFEKSSAAFIIEYAQTFNDLEFIVGDSEYIGYGVWNARQLISPLTNDFNIYTIYRDVIKKSIIRGNSGQIYLLPDERFFKVYNPAQYQKPIIVNSTRDKVIVIDVINSGNSGYSLVTVDNTYKINNFDNLLFTDGLTWLGNGIYVVPLTEDVFTKISGQVELIVYKFTIKTELNGTATLLKTEFKVKVFALKNRPENSTIWSASYAP